MINRKRLSFSLPDHNETTVQSDEWLEQALANATEAIGEYQSSRSLSAEVIQAITEGMDRFLTTDKVGKTAVSFNMPAIAGKVAFVYCDDVTNPDVFAEKVKAYIRNDRERFYVGKGRSADHAGGVVLLSRVSEKERAKLIAKREEQDRKAAEEEQEETTA